MRHTSCRCPSRRGALLSSRVDRSDRGRRPAHSDPARASSDAPCPAATPSPWRRSTARRGAPNTASLLLRQPAASLPTPSQYLDARQVARACVTGTPASICKGGSAPIASQSRAPSVAAHAAAPLFRAAPPARRAATGDPRPAPAPRPRRTRAVPAPRLAPLRVAAVPRPSPPLFSPTPCPASRSAPPPQRGTLPPPRAHECAAATPRRPAGSLEVIS